MRLVTAGNPNIGKTTLINALAGSDLKVGNWTGTTVERLSVTLKLKNGGVGELVDLPGTYSLSGATSEETVTRHELLNSPPDVILNVVDAGNLERNLYLTLELAELGVPMVLVLNLLDEARAHGIEVDPARLEAELGIPVVPTIASKGQVEGLEEALERAAVPGPTLYPSFVEEALSKLAGSRWQQVACLIDEPAGGALRADLERSGIDPFLAVAQARYTRARDVVAASTKALEPRRTFTQRVDSVVLNRALGLPLFFLGMLLVFRFTFLFSDPWITFMGTLQEVLAGWIAGLGLAPLVESFAAQGLVNGVGTILAFAPVLFCLYLAMSFLEASGFLARTAFLCDKLMKAVGLPGRAFIPLLLGFGCNVPAIYATRTLASFSDRLRVALAIPFMACSARLTVFTLFAAVFFPTYGSWVVFGLYLLGLAVGLGTAVLVRGLAPSDGDRTGLMELPPYRLPGPRVVLRQAWMRTASFVKGAGGPIMGAVLVVWLLLSIPPGAPDQSLYARVSKLLLVPLEPLGVTDWRLAGALIPGFIAKEVVIGTLGVSYLGAEPLTPLTFGAGLETLATGFKEAVLGTLAAVPQLVGLPTPTLPPVEAPGGLPAALAGTITPAGALAYLVLVQLYTPCVATIAAIRQEFGRRWAAFSLFYMLFVAYVLAFVASFLL